MNMLIGEAVKPFQSLTNGIAFISHTNIDGCIGFGKNRNNALAFFVVMIVVVSSYI